jgi:hypothetical protein
MLRDNVVAYRPGQWAPHDIVSRVDFAFRDDRRLSEARRLARETQPRIYKLTRPDPLTAEEYDQVVRVADGHTLIEWGATCCSG